MSGKLNEWRDEWEKQGERGAAVERFGEKLPDGFQVRAHWNPVALDWSEIRKDLQDFSERVELVAKILGPPDSVGGKHWVGSTDHAPDLVASWSVSIGDGDGSLGAEVFVRTLTPEGCKIDPRTAFAEAQETAIHPECAAVLRGLEEAGS